MDEFYSLGLLLSRASVSVAKLLNIELSNQNIDLPHSQFIVLRCIHFKGEISQQEIASLLCKDAAAIKRTIDNLEKKGLVTRKQISQRENHIQITNKGNELIPKAIECAKKALNQALTGFGKTEYQQLRKMLNLIYLNTNTAQ